MQQDRETILDILNTNIHPGRSEAREYKRHLPEQAVSNATAESLRAFIEVHTVLADLIHPDNYRTRHADKTSTGGYGVSYHTLPIGDGPKAPGIEIQAILLPTRNNWSGFLHAYLRGHIHPPVEGATPIGEYRVDLPVFQAICRPTPAFVNGLINAFRSSALFAR